MERNQANIDCFNKYSMKYEEWFEKNDKIYKQELSIIKKLIGDTPNGLEIGCGSGRFFIKPNIVIGIEPSDNMREIAIKKGLNAIKGDANNLNFEDRSFNFVLMMTTICFLYNPNIALKEVFRVLKKGGFLIVGFIDKNSPIGKNYEEKKHSSKFYSKAFFYSKDKVIQMCNSEGFTYASKNMVETDFGMVFIKFYKI